MPNLLALLLLSACTPDRSVTRGHPPRGYEVHGIDVSHHQGWIDWETVGASGIDFAFIKATEGATLADRRFGQNWENAAPHVPTGAYHYFSACHDGASQAAHFLRTVPEAGALPSVLDVEPDTRCNRGARLNGIDAEVTAWLDAVEQAHGARPIVYSSRSFHASHLASVEADRWVASYSRQPRGDWSWWQYTSVGRVPGIAGPVDRNVHAGPVLDLLR